MADSSRTVKSDETLLSIVQAVKRRQGATVTKIADELGLAKSTVHDHLSTLEQNEYVVKEAGQYSLGLRFLDLGINARKRYIPHELVTEKVDKLADETGERAQFVIIEHGRGVYLYQAFGDNAVKTDSYTGRRFPLHISAAGKAMMAFLPPENVEEILEKRGLRRDTKHTITDPDRLNAELQEIRERQYAFNEEESTEGLNAVGVAVRNEGGDVLGALSVSGPAHRLKGELFREEIPDFILGVGNELELHITFS